MHVHHGVKSQLSHLVTARPGAGQLTSLSFIFLLCKRGMSGFMEDRVGCYSYLIFLLSLVERRIVSPKNIHLNPNPR